MSSRKSSITAEVKVAGLAKFKSDLGSVGTAAKLAGKEISSIRPPDLVMTPVYQYWEARKRGEKMLTAATKAEADKRVKIEEQAAARNAMAMRTVIGNLRARPLMAPEINRPGGDGRFNHLAGGMFAGGTRGVMGRGGSGSGGGSNYHASAGYGLSVGYNAIQDLAQGGIAGIANNVPQIVQMVMASPILKTAGAAAVAAGSGIWALDKLKKAYDDFTGLKYDAARRLTHRQLQVEYEQKQVGISIGQAGIDGRSASESMAAEAAFENRKRVGQSREQERQDAIAAQREANRRNEINRIEDEEARIKELAAFEIKTLKEKAALEESRMRIEFQRAHEAKNAATEEYLATKAKIELIEQSEVTDMGLSDDERITLATLKGVIDAQREKSQAADARMGEAEAWADRVKQNNGVLPEIEGGINADAAANLKRIQESQSPFTKEKNDAIVREFNSAKQADRLRKENDKFEKEKAKQAEADSLTEKESMSRMTPRKLEKYQKEKRMAEEKKRLVGLGFDPETAASMAERGEKLNERAAMDQMNPKRIRGAGYAGQKDTRVTGLGTSTFDGLAELSAMQGDNMPSAPSAGRGIKGAGYKEPKQKNDGVSIARPDPLTSLLIKGLAAIEKAVRETGPSSNDRAKPLSTANR